MNSDEVIPAERRPRVLVLGGGGFIGGAVMRALEKAGMAPVAALRRRRSGSPDSACLCDATDLEAVTCAAVGADYAVNAVLGSPRTMQRATANLCERRAERDCGAWCMSAP